VQTFEIDCGVPPIVHPDPVQVIGHEVLQVPGTTVHGVFASTHVTPFCVTLVPGVTDDATWKVSVPTTVRPAIGDEEMFLKRAGRSGGRARR
jgi:hypothetical protein